jgi:hypothetical protein
MFNERFRMVPLKRRGIDWLLTIRRAQLPVRGGSSRILNLSAATLAR